MRRHAHNFKFRGDVRLLIGLVLVLAFTFPTVAMAKKCPTPGHPSCGGGDDGGDGIMTPQDTTATWSGAITSLGRDCWTFSSGNNPSNGGVTNECDTTEPSPDITIAFFPGELSAMGKKPELCGMLEDGLVFGDAINRITAFHFVSNPEYNGTICLDDGTGTTTCRIWVRNTFFGNVCHSSEEVSGACPGNRLIILEALGDANAAGDPEMNPFTIAQDIDMDELTFSIKAIGKNRTDAKCSVTSADLVTFSTVPR